MEKPEQVEKQIQVEKLSNLQARALFLILETSLTHGFYANYNTSTINTRLANAQWGASLSYQGLCTHDAWVDGVRRMEWLYQGLVEEEVEEARRLAKQEYQRQYDHERYAKKKDEIANTLSL
ncbi:hypothetical protein B0H65DRAFT_439050 [Neurospora tetraspora]|uniref:Uncharacterized protein n=1 Tax=Neurospora tetraspora TaxID=94610 RepID=A0AAE0JR13_9PEZI|nr:hypothetical protein B0H65DRAFT_439050 [Neurospora tetraspora]